MSTASKVTKESVPVGPRLDGRSHGQVRQIRITYDTFGNAIASVLFELGNTKILASASLQPNVPHFLRGQQTGWLTAEYAMLPCATGQRTNRESNLVQRHGRSVEISRLIGRSLRMMVDLSALGEKTIYVDCDVLQADGGTRVASITAGSIVLALANKRWNEAGILDRSCVVDELAAVSVGMVDGRPYADLAYTEDCNAEADCNFVMTRSGKIIEIQATAERRPISIEDFDRLNKMACDGVKDIFSMIDKQPCVHSGKQIPNKLDKKLSPFSLGRRLGTK